MGIFKGIATVAVGLGTAATGALGGTAKDFVRSENLRSSRNQQSISRSFDADSKRRATPSERRKK